MDDDSRMLSQDRDFKLAMRLSEFCLELGFDTQLRIKRYLRECYGFGL